MDAVPDVADAALRADDTSSDATLERAGGPGAEAAGRRFRFTPLQAHVASLLALAVVIAMSARGAQFFYDDRAIVAVLERGDLSWSWLVAPHNEHWILVPKLVYAALFLTVGAGSPAPYVAVVVILHLVFCHVLWRVSVRGGANPWLATTAVVGFAVYAAGIENVMFPMEMLLVGGMVLGGLTLLELSRPQPRWWLVVTLTVTNTVTFSLAPIFLVLAAALLIAQRRRRALASLVPALVLYLAWVLVQEPSVGGEPRRAGELLLAPLYWVMGVGNAVSSVVPWRSPAEAVTPGLDVVVALLACAGVALLLGFVLATQRWPGLRPGSLVTVFMLGAPLVVLVSSLSRLEYGLGYAMLSRYTYVDTAFLLPYALVALTRLATTARVGRAAAAVVVVGLTVANLVAWPAVSREWVDVTQQTARTLAAGQQLQRDGETLLPDMAEMAMFGFLSPSDLDVLDLRGVADDVTDTDRLTARLYAQTTIEAAPAPAEGCDRRPVSSIQIALPADDARFRLSVPADVAVTVVDGDGTSSRVQPRRLEAGDYRVRSVSSPATLQVRSRQGEATLALCRG